MSKITEATSKVNEEFPETLKSLGSSENYWNYRVVKKGSYYGIHEVHYTGEGKVEFLSENPVSIEADSKESVKWIMRMMQANWVLPTIDYDTLEEIDDII